MKHPVKIAAEPSPSRLAFAVSVVASPPVLAIAAMAAVASRHPGAAPWLAFSVYVVLGIALPLVWLFIQVDRGRVHDLELVRREERTRPMLIGAALSALATAALAVGGAPAPMVTLAAALWILTIIILVVTFFWKISVHAAAAAAAATLAAALSGGTLLPAAATAAVAWSRIRLGRHTILQTIAGALVGYGVLRLSI